MTKKILVWDLPVRLFHWFLVISLVAAWYTSDSERDLINYHLQIGYFILGLILFRLIWGVVGTKYALFNQCIPTWLKLINYLQSKQQQENDNMIGHNPLGGLMIVMMLSLVLSQAISGLFMNDDIFTSGPYYESASEAIQQFMSLIHHNAFDVIIILSMIHIVAVFYHLLVKKINLILPMFTGYKLSEREKNNGIKSSKLLLAFILSLSVAFFLYWLLVLNIPVEEEFYY